MQPLLAQELFSRKQAFLFSVRLLIEKKEQKEIEDTWLRRRKLLVSKIAQLTRNELASQPGDCHIVGNGIMRN